MTTGTRVKIVGETAPFQGFEGTVVGLRSMLSLDAADVLVDGTDVPQTYYLTELTHEEQTLTHRL